MVSKSLFKLSGMALCCLLVLTFFTPLPVIYAADYTATQNGNWNDNATWGGSGVPGDEDNVIIPNGIAVTIPGDLTVTRNQVTTINGTLVNNGMLINVGVLDNNSSFTNDGTFHTYGTTYNDDTFTNNGTFSNDGGITNTSVFNNYGTVDNDSYISNDGTFNNNGRINNNHNATFSNNGTITNITMFFHTCTATYTGNLIQGKPARSNCVGAAPISPTHRTHSANPRPNFTWNAVVDADAYRIRVYTETRSYLVTVLVSGGSTTSYTWQEDLPVGKYLWRVRVRNGSIPAWGNFSKRFTIFIQ